MLARAQDRPGSQAILIVEDSLLDQRIMARVVRRCHASVPLVVAVTLASARRELARQSIRHIFLDNALPDGKGADFVMELVESGLIRQIPVTLVTDAPSPFMFAKARHAGITVLQKAEFVPARVEALLST
jgi:response regulator of citrate/malate metabolism